MILIASLPLGDFASFRKSPKKPPRESGDVQATFRMLTKVGGIHVMPLSDAMQLSDRVGWFSEPITGRRTQPVKVPGPVSPGEMSSE